eukprot:c2442_g1_i1 orf=269-511(+)
MLLRCFFETFLFIEELPTVNSHICPISCDHLVLMRTCRFVRDHEEIPMWKQINPPKGHFNLLKGDCFLLDLVDAPHIVQV